MHFRSLILKCNFSMEGDDLKIYPLKKVIRKYIFAGLEQILSEKHRDTIWKMVWNRWCYFEQICNQEKRFK